MPNKNGSVRGADNQRARSRSQNKSRPQHSGSKKPAQDKSPGNAHSRNDSQSNVGSVKQRSTSKSHKSKPPGKAIVEKTLNLNYVEESQAYLERIEQVYRHYTAND